MPTQERRAPLRRLSSVDQIEDDEQEMRLPSPTYKPDFIVFDGDSAGKIELSQTYAEKAISNQT